MSSFEILHSFLKNTPWKHTELRFIFVLYRFWHPSRISNIGSTDGGNFLYFHTNIFLVLSCKLIARGCKVGYKSGWVRVKRKMVGDRHMKWNHKQNEHHLAFRTRKSFTCECGCSLYLRSDIISIFLMYIYFMGSTCTEYSERSVCCGDLIF